MEANFNLSLSMLLIGDYKNAWRRYESRRKFPSYNVDVYKGSSWEGDLDIAGKTILLYAEQGLGDSIQFSRYAGMVKCLGGKVIMHVPQSLVGIMKSIRGVDAAIPLDIIPPNYDVHCSLMSLPMIFRTTLDSIPLAEGYMKADVSNKRKWHKKISNIPGPKIGICWQGSDHPMVANSWSNVNSRRNVPLELLANVFHDVEVTFFSLQKVKSSEKKLEENFEKYWPRRNFIDFTHEINDFSDLAGLVENLDLVISVDTSVAHLAGAVGTSTWLLNRFDSCWRWLLVRSDSPWYKSIKLYRQQEDLDWEKVLLVMKQDLHKYILYN